MIKFLLIVFLIYLSIGKAYSDKKIPISTMSISKWNYKCLTEDFKKYVATEKGCIALQHLGKIDKEKNILIVFLHGDSKIQGDYDIKKRWGDFSKIIKDQKKNINFLFLARPGHKFKGRNRSAGKYKNYELTSLTKTVSQNFKKSWESNKLISQALFRLREFYQPKELIVVGFSGGAYDIGIISGKVPGLIDVGIMGGCYCYISKKNFWVPGEFTNKIDLKTKLILINGKDDQSIGYAKSYYRKAKQAGLDIKFHSVEGGHGTETFLSKQGMSIFKNVLYNYK